jgi:hypothetical protein
MRRPARQMSATDPKDGEPVTRREAAERLTDLAYALTVGGPFTVEDEEMAGQVPDELVMKRKSTAEDDRVALRLELSWSTRGGPGRPARAPHLAQPRGADQAQVPGALDGFGAAVGVELRVDVAQMGPDGVGGDVKLGRDLGGLQVARQVPDHPQLGLAQLLGRLGDGTAR